MSSRTIEQKVVEMQFNNSNFERNVSQSMSTLDKLKQALGNMSAGHAFEDLGKAANKLDFSNVGTETDKVSGKFSALQELATGALRQIGADIETYLVGGMKKAANALVLDNIRGGFDRYGQLMESTQTILSAIDADQINGVDSLEYVEDLLNKLAWFSDETSYNFSDMTDNISKFVAAGLDLDLSTNAMMGIATWAAQAGQTANVASRAMYQLSQAMGSGSIKLVDWKSIEIANMATKEVKEMLLEYGVAGGELIKIADGMYLTAAYANSSKEEIQKLIDTESKAIITANNFREHLTEEQWLTGDIFGQAMSEYSSYANALEEIIHSDKNADLDLYASDLIRKIDVAAKEAKKTGRTIEEVMSEKYQIDLMVTDEHGNLHSALDGVTALAIKAMKAAQQARTLGQALDSVRDAASTKWMTIFKKLFGNVEEATVLFTNLSEYLYNFFVTPLDGIIDTLQQWRERGGWKVLFGERGETEEEDIPGALQNIVTAIEKVQEAVKVGIFGEEALDDDFDAKHAKEMGDALYELTLKFKDFTESLIPTEDEMAFISKVVADLTKLFGDLSGVLGTIIGYLGAVFDAVGRFIAPVVEGIESVFNSQLFRPENLNPSGYQLLIAVFNDIYELATVIADKLAPSERALEEIKTIFEGIDAAIDIILSPLAFVHQEIRALLDGDGQDPENSALGKFASFISGPFLEALLWLPSKLAEAVKGLRDYLNEDNKVTKFLGNLKEFGKGFYDAMFPNGIIDKLKELKTTVSDFFTNLMGGSETIDKIKTKVKEVFDSIRNFLSENLNYESGKKAFESIAGAVNSIKEAVKSFFADPKQAIKDAYEAISKWIDENVNLEKVGGKLGEVFSKIGSFFKENYEKVSEWLGLNGAIETVLGKISEFAINIKDAFVNAYKAVAGFFGMFGSGTEDAGDAAETVTRSLTRSSDPYADSGLGLSDNLLSGSGRKKKPSGVANDVNKKEDSAFGGGPVLELISGRPINITPLEKFALAAVKVFNKIGEAIVFVKEKLKELLNAIKYVWEKIDISGWIQRNFGSFGGLLKAVGDAAVKVVTTIFNVTKTVVKWLSETASKIAKAWKDTGMGPAIGQFFGDLWAEIKQAFENLNAEDGSQQVGLLTKAFTVIKNAFKEFGDILTSSHIIELLSAIGFEKLGIGIAKIGKGFYEAVWAIEKGVKNFTKAMKIEAFANVFKQIGIFILELVGAAIALTVTLNASEGSAEALNYALVIIAGFVGGITGAAYELIKLINPNSSTDFVKYTAGLGAFFAGLGTAILEIVTSMVMLSGVIVLLNKIPDGQGIIALGEALGAIAALIVVLGVAAKGLSDKGGAGAGVAVLLLSFAISNLVGTLTILVGEFLILNKLTNGMQAMFDSALVMAVLIAGIYRVIVGLSSIDAGKVFAGVVAIGVLTASITAIGLLIGSLASITNADKVLPIGTAIVALLFVMGLVISAFDKIKDPKGVLAGSFAMVLLAWSMSIVGNLIIAASEATRSGGGDTLAKVLPILAVVGALGAALWLVAKSEKDVLSAGKAFLAMAASLAIVSVLVNVLANALQDNPLATIGAFAILAAVVAGLAFAATKVAPAADGFLKFAGAVAILGAGLLLVAIGISALVDAIVYAATAFVENGNTIGLVLTNICMWIINSEDLILQTLSVLILNILQAILNSKEAFIEMIVTFIEGVLKVLSEHGPTIVGYLAELLKAIWDGLVEVLEHMWVDIERWIGNLWEKLKTFVGELLGKLAAFILNFIEELKNLPNRIVQIILDFIHTVLDALANLVEGISKEVAEFVARLINTARETFDTIWTAIKDFVLDVVEEIGSFLVELVAIIKEKTLAIWESIKEVIEFIVDGIFDLLHTITTRFDKFFKEDLMPFINNIVDEITDLVNKIIDKVGFTSEDGLGNRILTEIETIIKRILEDIRTFGEDFVQTGLDVLGFFCDGIKKSIQTVLDTISTVVLSILHFIPTYVEDFIQAIVDLINGIADSIEHHAPEFWTAITRLAKAIVDAIFYPLSGGSDKEGTLLNLGKNIMEGLSSGLSSAWEDIKEKVGNVGKKVIGVFKSIFGIASPSKVMKEMGGFLDEGLAIGIDKNSNLPIDSMSEMGGGLLDGLKGSFSGKDLQSFLNGEIGSVDLEGALTSLVSSQPNSESLFGSYGDGLTSVMEDAVSKVSIPETSFGDDIGTNLSNSMEQALSNANDMAQFDSFEPTITPVIDLSEIQNGMGDMDSMLNGMNDYSLNSAMNANYSPFEDYDGTVKVDPTSDISVKMSGLELKFDEMIEKLANLKVILDSGALVGGIVDPMDKALGNRTVVAGRGGM